MQDPSSLYSQIKSQSQSQPQFPEQEQLKCPRCDSTNTKFCYYNNYNLSQPRHFCKSCRRYWTKGGALRNIPVGGGSRKHTKRISSSASSSSKRPPAPPPPPSPPTVSNNVENPLPLKGDKFEGQFGNFLEAATGTGTGTGAGSFSSLLGSTGGHFGNFLDGLGLGSPTLQINDHFGDPGSNRNVDLQVNNTDRFLNIQSGDDSGNGETACWSGNSNAWPDLAMYTPGSSFH